VRHPAWTALVMIGLGRSVVAAAARRNWAGILTQGWRRPAFLGVRRSASRARVAAGGLLVCGLLALRDRFPAPLALMLVLDAAVPSPRSTSRYS